MRSRFLGVAIVGWMMTLNALAATHYVVPPGTAGVTPAPNFTSWGTAATNIQDALDVAVNGEVVLVTNGTYVLDATVEVTNGITLRSFNDGSVDRDGTVLNGNYPAASNRCVYMTGAGSVIDGFTITNGYSTAASLSGHGAGVHLDEGGIVTNCLVTGNECGAGVGGGIYLYHGGWVVDSTISGNVVTNANAGKGGGVYIDNAGCLVSDCLIEANRANSGAGVWFYGLYGVSTLRDCTVAKNEALVYASGQGQAGIGMFFRGLIDHCSIISNKITRFNGSGYGSGVNLHNWAVIRDSLIAYNTGASYGGGLVCTANGANPALATNCVIRNNIGGNGAGIYIGGSGTGSMVVNCSIISNSAAVFAQGGIARNCLFAYNSSHIWAYSGTGGRYENCTVVGHPGVGIYFRVPATVDNCVVYSNNSGGVNWSAGAGVVPVWTNSCTTPLPSGPDDSGNTDNPPSFKDAAASNYRLKFDSPCVDKGINRGWMSDEVDLDGLPRINGDTVDMGAYEFVAKGTMVTIQ